MKISLITDEVSADLETAIELGSRWGISDYELRTVGDNRVPNLSNYQKSRVEELLDEYHSRIIAISPGLFKCPFPGLRALIQQAQPVPKVPAGRSSSGFLME